MKHTVHHHRLAHLGPVLAAAALLGTTGVGVARAEADVGPEHTVQGDDLASTLALGGCGDPVEQAAPAAAAQAPAIDYSNYLDAPERAALRQAQTHTIGDGNDLPGSERRPAHASHTQDHQHSVDGGLDLRDVAELSGSPRASVHGTQDRVATIE